MQSRLTAPQPLHHTGLLIDSPVLAAFPISWTTGLPQAACRSAARPCEQLTKPSILQNVALSDTCEQRKAHTCEAMGVLSLWSS